MRVSGFSPIVSAVAALIVWTLHFGLVYATNAIACERELAGQRLLGLPLVPVLVLGATAVALAVVAVIGLRARRRLEHGLAGQEGEDASRFMPWFTMGVALLSGLAILLEGLPVFFVPYCS